MPCVAELAIVVDVPKFAASVEPEIEIPCDPEPVTDVVPETVSVPPTPDRVMPGPPGALVAVKLSNVAANEPVVRFSGLPVPFRSISEVVSVPKPVPVISVAVVLPILNPRSVLPEASVKALVAAALVVTIGRAPPRVGNASLFGASVMPAIVASEPVAPLTDHFLVGFQRNAAGVPA